MTDGLLEEIILLEQQLQRQLAAEEERVARWQAQELAALEEVVALARQNAGAGLDGALADARRAAEEEARRLIEAAESRGRRLGALDDETLRHVLAKHLAMIIPEVDDDHPHGQS